MKLTFKNPFAKKQVAAPRAYVAPVQLRRIRQDAETRRSAINEAENAYFPHRVRLQQMYLNTKENGHIKSCIERRKDLTILRKWEFRDANGNIDDKTTSIFCEVVNGKTQLKKWFINYLSFSLDALFFGYSLIKLGDVIDGEFKQISVEKRWHVSPDRRNIVSFPYMINGTCFDDEEFKDWYVFVDTPNDTGISKCGYGLFYELSVYEIFLRNLMGFNGDFIELFAQPFRVGKTNKTEEDERAEFESAIRDMGSSGYAILDDIGETVEFIESKNSGTGFNGYDNFEKRLEDKTSRLILGHADAMSSVAGKLGNDSKESPAQQALEDKATADAAFILPLINNELIPRMRNIGFNIPDGVTACMQNDSEERELMENTVDIAVKMKSAGLQMEAKYFTEKTGIPVAEPAPLPKPFSTAVQNKLNELYR